MIFGVPFMDQLTSIVDFRIISKKYTELNQKQTKSYYLNYLIERERKRKRERNRKSSKCYSFGYSIPEKTSFLSIYCYGFHYRDFHCRYVKLHFKVTFWETPQDKIFTFSMSSSFFLFSLAYC